MREKKVYHKIDINRSRFCTGCLSNQQLTHSHLVPRSYNRDLVCEEKNIAIPLLMPWRIKGGITELVFHARNPNRIPSIYIWINQYGFIWIIAKSNAVTSTALVMSFQCFSSTCCKNPLNNNSSPRGATITTAVNNKTNPVMLSGCKSPFRSRI